MADFTNTDGHENVLLITVRRDGRVGTRMDAKQSKHGTDFIRCRPRKRVPASLPVAKVATVRESSMNSRMRTDGTTAGTVLAEVPESADMALFDIRGNVFVSLREMAGITVPFGVRWETLRDRCKELPGDATLITSLATTDFGSLKSRTTEPVRI